MSHSKLSIFIVFGILSLAVIYLLISISDLKHDLNAITQQLEATNQTLSTASLKFSQQMADISKSEAEPKSHTAGIQTLVRNSGRLIDDISQRLEAIERNFTLSSRDDSLPEAELYEPSAFDESARISGVAALGKSEQQFILDQALTDPVKEDPIWSANAVLEIEHYFTNSPGSDIVSDFSVTCGGELCKIETIFPKGADYLEKEMFEMNLLADLSALSSRSLSNQSILADGSAKIVRYMARKGFYLPTETPAPVSTQTGVSKMAGSDPGQ